MPNSIGNRSPDQLVEAIDANLIESSILLGQTQDGAIHRSAELTWVYSGHRTLNRIFGSHFNPDQAEDRIAEVAECFRQWDAPVLWVVGSNSKPVRLNEYLAENGFGISENWVGSACSLEDFAAPVEPVSGLSFQQITDPKQIKSWVEVSNAPWGSEASDAATSIFSTAIASSGTHSQFYLALLKDRVVARCMAYIHKNVVGLYWVASSSQPADAEYESALVAHVLMQAKASGCTLAVTVGPEKSQSPNVNAAFKVCCHFHVYAWPALPIRMPV